MESILKEIKAIDTKCLHLIMDEWTSRQKFSVIGVTAQYVKDWKIVRRVLGFEEFSEAHNAVNTKKKIDELCFGKLKIQEAQVCFPTFPTAVGNLNLFFYFFYLGL
jgi:hypothetical protein